MVPDVPKAEKDVPSYPVPEVFPSDGRFPFSLFPIGIQSMLVPGVFPMGKCVFPMGKETTALHTYVLGREREAGKEGRREGGRDQGGREGERACELVMCMVECELHLSDLHLSELHLSSGTCTDRLFVTTSKEKRRRPHYVAYAHHNAHQRGQVPLDAGQHEKPDAVAPDEQRKGIVEERHGTNVKH